MGLQLNLHGKTVKAANTRSLVPWAVDLCGKYLDHTVYERSMAKICRCADEMVSILYSADMFLTAEEQRQFQENVLRFCLHNACKHLPAGLEAQFGAHLHMLTYICVYMHRDISISWACSSTRAQLHSPHIYIYIYIHIYTSYA